MNFDNVFKKKQFIPYITCGYPTKKDTIDIVKLFLDKGVEIIELGIPFSDPVADGPTIQYSSYIALKNGTNIDDVFDVVKETIKYKFYYPVLMTYLNPPIIYGIEKFFKKARDCGVKGIIFADCIAEEDYVFSMSRKYNIDTILLLAPTTSYERRKIIYEKTTGFVYVVTLTGTTGERTNLPEYFYKFVKKIRKETKKPLCAGFGISKVEQVLPILDYVNGFIVGSKIINIIREQKDIRQAYKKLEEFVDEFLKINLGFKN
jgi:tryptophan synthase alpha chain